MQLMPDFIFTRDRDAERDGHLALAGQLVTDIPKWRSRRRADEELIADVVQQITAKVRSEPELTQCGVWLGPIPENGLDPPFDAELMAERRRRFIVVAVQLDRL